jgi:hypothetical protein
MSAKPRLDRFQHHVGLVRAADAGTCHGAPGGNFAVMGAWDEGSTDDIPIPACELQAIGAPAQVRVYRRASSRF